MQREELSGQDAGHQNAFGPQSGSQGPPDDRISM